MVLIYSFDLIIFLFGGYGGGYGAPAGYGAPGSIPDPYAQPPAYGGYGVPPQPGFGGGYY